MEILEKFTVKAPIGKVWQFLLNAEQVAGCIPGCEKVEKLDERNYVATVRAGVGPIKVRFNINTVLTQIDEPNHIRMEQKGVDLGKAGSFSQSSDLYLREVSARETEISFSANVTVVGRIALFGDRIMRAQAKKIGEEFKHNLQEKIEGQLKEA